MIEAQLSKPSGFVSGTSPTLLLNVTFVSTRSRGALLELRVGVVGLFWRKRLLSIQIASPAQISEGLQGATGHGV